MLEIYGHEIYNAPAQESAKLKEKKDLKMENAYGHLLTLGGVLVGECINTASTNETARYVATVRLGNDETRAEATSKKQAIRLASQQILEATGEYDCDASRRATLRASPRAPSDERTSVRPSISTTQYSTRVFPRVCQCRRHPDTDETNVAPPTPRASG